MKRWLRRRLNALWWWLESRRWRWRIYREVFRRLWRGLTVDLNVQARIMLTYVFIGLTTLALHYTSGRWRIAVALGGVIVLLAALPVLFSLRGWSRYPAVLNEVLQEEYERIEGENKEWYFSELFGNGRPPQSIIDKYGEPPGMKQGHQDGGPDESGM